MESDLCYRLGDHYSCSGRIAGRSCSCSCHPRPGRRQAEPNAPMIQTGLAGYATWRAVDDELWQP
jgi:hypothetical protein